MLLLFLLVGIATPEPRRESATAEARPVLQAVSMVNGFLSTGLQNERGLIADLSVGSQAVESTRNARGLRLVLGPVPQALKAASSEDFPKTDAALWILY